MRFFGWLLIRASQVQEANVRAFWWGAEEQKSLDLTDQLR